MQSLLEVLVAAQEPPPMSLLAAMGLQGAMGNLPVSGGEAASPYGTNSAMARQ